MIVNARSPYNVSMIVSPKKDDFDVGEIMIEKNGRRQINTWMDLKAVVRRSRRKLSQVTSSSSSSMPSSSSS